MNFPVNVERVRSIFSYRNSFVLLRTLSWIIDQLDASHWRSPSRTKLVPMDPVDSLLQMLTSGCPPLDFSADTLLIALSSHHYRTTLFASRIVPESRVARGLTVTLELPTPLTGCL